MDNYGADGSGDANNSHRGMGRGRVRNTSTPRQAAQSLRRPHGATQVTPATGFKTNLFYFIFFKSDF